RKLKQLASPETPKRNCSSLLDSGGSARSGEPLQASLWRPTKIRIHVRGVGRACTRSTSDKHVGGASNRHDRGSHNTNAAAPEMPCARRASLVARSSAHPSVPQTEERTPMQALRPAAGSDPRACPIFQETFSWSQRQ